MKCCVCKLPIGRRATRVYAIVPNHAGGTRKVYAHSPKCDARFDALVDHLHATEELRLLVGGESPHPIEDNLDRRKDGHRNP